MAGERDEARIPLLASQNSSQDELSELRDEFDVQYAVKDGRKAQVLGWAGSDLPPDGTTEVLAAGRTSSREGGGGRGLRRVGSEQSYSSRPRKKQQYTGSEMIVAVFVVAFDTKKGNVVEWKYPSEVILEGIEFKSMASGLHKITKDFIYFKQNQLYGLSCFEKIPVASQAERGARMKSVGLLAVGYSDLHLHMDFLQRQVRAQVESPGEYGSLEEYFRHYRSPQMAPPTISVTESLPTMSPSSLKPDHRIEHPVGCFAEFLQFFGVRVFTLWRLALLKKRVLLFSSPPVGTVCHRVYCTCLLCNHALSADLSTECSPQFYVNVADIDHMESLDNYVACTTEKIFQSKARLYDVFVDGCEFLSPSETMASLFKTTPWDQRKFEHLSNIRSNDVTASARNRDDIIFAEYFEELNSQLFRVLLDAADSEDHVLTVEMVEGVQLDPVKDRLFLTELARVYSLDYTVQRHTDMFSCCL